MGLCMFYHVLLTQRDYKFCHFPKLSKLESRLSRFMSENSGYNNTSLLIFLSIFISGFNRYSLVADKQMDRHPGLSNRVPISLFGTES